MDQLLWHIYQLLDMVSDWVCFSFVPALDEVHLHLLPSLFSLCHHILGFLSHQPTGMNDYYHFTMVNISHLFQVVPGRMDLLVTLFLSLTTLLVSTITSSPPVVSQLTVSQPISGAMDLQKSILCWSVWPYYVQQQ